MRKSRCNLGICGLALALLGLPVWAQPATRSVADLIETLKARKEMALDPQSQVRRGQGGQDAVGDADSPPLVWSVSGLNGDYSAVLVINRKVYNVRSAMLPQRVGGWRVHRIGAQTVCVSLRAESQCLPTPDSATTAHAFVQALHAAGAGKTEAAMSMAVPASTAADAASNPVGDAALSQALSARLPSLPTPPEVSHDRTAQPR